MANVCQSCGMPLNKDPDHGGTEADGSKSEKFCSFCYVDGAFTQPDFNVEEMQAFCIDILQKRGMPRFMGWMFTRSLPKLERWQS